MIIPNDIPTAITRAESEKLAELGAGKRVLEVGADRGHSTIVLASVATELDTIDWFQGDPQAGIRDALPEFWENLSRYGVRGGGTHIHIGDSNQLLHKLPDYYYDFIFVDAQHDEVSVRRDLDLVVKKLRRPGVIACHDYGRFEVEPAVKSFTEAVGGNLSVTDWLAVIEVPATVEADPAEPYEQGIKRGPGRPRKQA